MAGQDLTGYDMNFYCLDLTNTAQVRTYSTPEAAYVIFCQAEDRELRQIEKIFQVIDDQPAAYSAVLDAWPLPDCNSCL